MSSLISLRTHALTRQAAVRTAPHFSSRALDHGLRLSQRFSDCLRDKRKPLFIIHSYHDLLKQRIYGICCGYEDCNDAARVAGDPVHRLLLFSGIPSDWAGR